MCPANKLDQQPESASGKIIINMVLDEGSLPGEIEALLEKMKREGKLRPWDGLEESPAWKTSAVYTLRLDEGVAAREIDPSTFSAPASRSMAAGRS